MKYLLISLTFTLIIVHAMLTPVHADFMFSSNKAINMNTIADAKAETTPPVEQPVRKQTEQPVQKQTNNGPFYSGVDIVVVHYEESSGLSSNPIVLRGILGAQLNEYISAEINAGLGIIEGETKYGSATAYMNVDSFIGFYVKPTIPVSDNFKMFGKLGFTSASATISVYNTGSYSDSVSGLSYGVGVEFGNNNTFVTIEYMNYFRDEFYSISGISSGIKVYF